MEPAILWFERRVHRVKRLTKRQTLEALRRASKGRRPYSVSTYILNKEIITRSSGIRARRAISASSATPDAARSGRIFFPRQRLL
jgi:hypothetical protein